MNWKKELSLDPKRIHHGCLNCSHIELTCPLSRVLDVGFGQVTVKKDGETVFEYIGRPDDPEPPTLRKFENKARRDPDHDWRVEFYGPLHGEIYQRHEKNKWVLISSNMGFA